MKIRKPRYQQIKYDAKGLAYVKFNNTKHMLSDFMRYDIVYYWDGYKVMSNTHSLLIKISDCGDAAKVTLQ
jgi:hypothetical protein